MYVYFNLILLGSQTLSNHDELNILNVTKKTFMRANLKIQFAWIVHARNSLYAAWYVQTKDMPNIIEEHLKQYQIKQKKFPKKKTHAIQMNL